MTAIFVLTLRQLAGSRRLWLVAALVSLPVLAGLVFHAADATATPDEFADDITSTLLASTILPFSSARSRSSHARSRSSQDT